jgi:hypothetical protein
MATEANNKAVLLIPIHPFRNGAEEERV